MIIYGTSISPYVRKVLAYCNARNLEFTNIPVGLIDKDEAFLQASPFGKFPALRDDDDFTLADSSAIIHYLEAKHPQSPLLPADPKLRGQTIWFEEFADTLLFSCGATIFFNRVIAPLFLKQDGDIAAAQTAETEALPPLLHYLESQIPASGFLVNDQFGLADIAVTCPFVNLEHAQTVIDAGQYPKLTQYLSNMMERPEFAAIISKERQLVAKSRAMVSA